MTKRGLASRYDLLKASILGLLAGALAAMLYLSIAGSDDAEWEEFSREHNCVKTGVSRETRKWTGNAAYQYEEIEFRCDGNMFVWRRR